MTPPESSRFERELGTITQQIASLTTEFVNLRMQLVNTVQKDVFEARMDTLRVRHDSVLKDLDDAKGRIKKIEDTQESDRKWRRNFLMVGLLAPIVTGLVLAWVLASGVAP